MRRTRMMLAASAVALSTLTAGAGIASAQAEPDPELAEQCRSYDLIEWLVFHHECHGHTTGIVYWPW